MPHDGNDHSAISHNSDDAVLFRFLVSSSASDWDCDCHQRTLCCGNRVSYRSNRLVGELKLARSCVLLKTVQNDAGDMSRMRVCLALTQPVDPFFLECHANGLAENGRRNIQGFQAGDMRDSITVRMSEN
jgi:hypothetical protein